MIAEALEARDACLAAEEAVRLAYVARDAALVELRESGMTVRDVGELMGVSAARVSQVQKTHAGRVWGPVPRYTASWHLQAARDAFTAARHAQELRCEAYAMGYKAETEAFYGSDKVAQSDSAEDRVTFRGWHEGQARQTAEVS